MTSIMMNSMDIGRKWCRMELRQYIKPKSRVAILGFCPEGERITSENEWNSIYGAQNGAYYGYLTDPFKFFGVNSFEWINILKDSPRKAAQKIKKADILLLPHGVFPDMIEVIEKLNLVDAIAEFDKTIIGFGTGAAILLDEYITENNEEFCGLGLIKNMGLVFNFEDIDFERDDVVNFAANKNKPLFALYDTGALAVDGDEIFMIGDVEVID